ncbi:MAG: oligosaccharide flippase family protein, partial [Candidatus Levybacteria bacterium]|nr:oligosaccharide flippase family protein [Candidatus Levybacteria bacterium]
MIKIDNDIAQLKNRVIKGISVLLVREMLLKVIAVAGQLVLVRILSPDFFGIYAIIAFIVSFAGFATNLGVSTAIIQKKEKLSISQTSSLFVLLEILSIVAVAIIYLLTPFFASLYPVLQNENFYYLPLFSLSLLFMPLQTILMSLLDKELRYDAIAKIDSVGIVVYYAVVLILALSGFNVLSFIYAVLAKEFAELVACLYFKRIKIKIMFRFGDVKSILTYGFSIQIGGAILLLHNSLIPLLGGRLFGVIPVGYLYWSKNISSLPNTVLDNYGRAAFAGIARIQDRTELVSKAINKSIQFLNIAIFFFALLLVSFTSDFIHFIATDKWLPAQNVLQWFLLGSLFSGVITALGQGLVAIGKAKELTTLSAILVLFEFILAFILIYYFGFVGISIAFFFHAILQFISYSFLARINKISLLFLRSFMNSILIFIFCYLLAQILNFMMPANLLSYISKLVIISTIYLFIYHALS